MNPAHVLEVVVGLVLGMCAHEAAHAGVADLCGDDTARRAGRMTLNPFVHAGRWGWRPVPIDRTRLSSGGFVAALAAGPAANLFVALVFAVTGPLWWACMVNLFCCAVNLLPVPAHGRFPALDGWWIASELRFARFARRERERIAYAEWYARQRERIAYAERRLVTGPGNKYPDPKQNVEEGSDALR